MTDYTPTKDQMRAYYTAARLDGWRLEGVPMATPEEAAAEFDRWITNNDVEVSADAWDEGRASTNIMLPTDPPQHPKNPYRARAGGEEFNPDSDWKRPSVYIQYKGSNICIDFHCLCDQENEHTGVGHFDGDFAYALQCSRCGRVYEMPTELALTLVETTEFQPRVIHPDAEER